MSSSESSEDISQIEKHPDDAVVFASSLVEQVNPEDITSMVYIQRDMLSRFEKTNEMLINFNILSTGRYEATVKDFQKNTQLLYDMKKDLDSVFKRIRVLKHRLEKTYPEAFAACSSIYNVVSDEDDDSDAESLATVQSSLASEDSKSKNMTVNSSQTSGSQEPPAVTVTVTGPKSPTGQDQAKSKASG